MSRDLRLVLGALLRGAARLHDRGLAHRPDDARSEAARPVLRCGPAGEDRRGPRPRMARRDGPGEPDFRIIDVSNPRHPVKVGEWGAWKELGRHPNDGQGNEFSASFVHSVITDEQTKRAYLSYWDLGTIIL